MWPNWIRAADDCAYGFIPVRVRLAALADVAPALGVPSTLVVLRLWAELAALDAVPARGPRALVVCCRRQRDIRGAGAGAGTAGGSRAPRRGLRLVLPERMRRLRVRSSWTACRGIPREVTVSTECRTHDHQRYFLPIWLSVAPIESFAVCSRSTRWYQMRP